MKNCCDSGEGPLLQPFLLLEFAVLSFTLCPSRGIDDLIGPRPCTDQGGWAAPTCPVNKKVTDKLLRTTAGQLRRRSDHSQLRTKRRRSNHSQLTNNAGEAMIPNKQKTTSTIRDNEGKKTNRGEDETTNNVDMYRNHKQRIQIRRPVPKQNSIPQNPNKLLLTN